MSTMEVRVCMSSQSSVPWVKGAQAWDIRRRDFCSNQTYMVRLLSNKAQKSKKITFGALYYPLFPEIFVLTL
jgi:hypothetical protein